MPTPNDPYDDIVTPPVPDDRLSELAIVPQRAQVSWNSTRHDTTDRNVVMPRKEAVLQP